MHDICLLNIHGLERKRKVFSDKTNRISKDTICDDILKGMLKYITK
jgi:hypothetical protein